MDKKLTDSEIVKGLECHSRPSNSCGSNCPYLMCEEVMCTKKLSKDALDLINRLQAENGEYSHNSVVMKRDILNLQAENERLKPFENKIAGFNSHIRVEDMLVFASSLEEWLEFCENLKAEANKEFAEKTNNIIESLIEQYSIKDFEEFKAICQVLRGLKNDTNNLLKELVGDSNAE